MTKFDSFCFQVGGKKGLPCFLVPSAHPFNAPVAQLQMMYEPGETYRFIIPFPPLGDEDDKSFRVPAFIVYNKVPQVIFSDGDVIMSESDCACWHLLLC